MKSVARLLTTALAALCFSSAAVSVHANDTNTVRAFYYSLDDVFMSQLSASLQDQALALGIHLVQYDARNDLVKQITQVETALAASNSHAPIMVNPVDMGESTAVLKLARNHKNPVIFFNRIPSMSAMRTYKDAWYVGAAAEEAGTFQAEVVLEYIEKHPELDKNKDGVLNYVLFQGEEDHIDTVERTRKFIKRLEQAKVNLRLLDSAQANWSRSLAEQHMQNILDIFELQDIEFVVCNNDAMALGVVDALQSKGYNLESGNSFVDADAHDNKKMTKFIPVFGIDAIPQALVAISKGTMAGTVLNDTQSVGNACMEIIRSYLDDEPVTEESIGYPIVNRIVKIPYLKVTYQNIDSVQCDENLGTPR